MQDSRSLNIDMTNSYLNSSIALTFFPSEFPEEANSYLSVSSIHKVCKERLVANPEKRCSSSQAPKSSSGRTLEKTETEHETCEGTFENDSALMEISAVLMVHECKEILQDLQQRLFFNVNKISQENEEHAKLSRLAEDLKLKHRDSLFNSKIKPGCSCSIV